MITSNTNIFCLIGNPVKKSLSPNIHNTSFKINNIDSRYVVFNINEDKLNECINGIKALNISGFNVTMPYKQKIIKHLDYLDESASIIGAVNTVKNDNGKLIGYNTDGLGFLESIKNEFENLTNIKAVLIGAGGAARAIGFYLSKYKIKELLIINRTKDKAKTLAQDINEYHDTFIKYDSLNNSNINLKDYDLIINSTSVGMYPNINQSPIDINEISEKSFVYDIIYNPIKTKLLSDCEKRNIKSKNGLDMLIYQALLSEEIWLNKKVNTNKLKENIKKRIL